MERLCDFPDRRFVIDCRSCDRRGAYHLDRLMRRFGEHASVFDVYVRLTQSCRWQREVGSRRHNVYGTTCRAKVVTQGPIAIRSRM